MLNLFLQEGQQEVVEGLEAESTEKTLSIMDAIGNTVKTIANPGPTLDIAELAEGIYFLQIQIGNSLINKKLIKK